VNCEILSTLYVKANGEIPCHDDAGESITLGHIGQCGPAGIHQLLEGKTYDHIHRALASSQVPWPGTCESCAFLRRGDALDNRIARRELRTLQIEPSLQCSLECPGCSRAEQVARRSGPTIMSPDLIEGLLSSLAAWDYRIEAIDYCGQGEPLSNPRFLEFLQLSHGYFPGAYRRLTTNGNYDYAKSIGGQQLDEVCVSVDGAWQTSYETYRRGGSFARALGFMSDAVASGTAPRPFVIWKYILFEHNDSVSELARAQAIAAEIGVDRLVFVLTHSAGRSTRYTARNWRSIPIASSRAVVLVTPALAVGNHSGRGVSGALLRRVAEALRPAVMRRPSLRRRLSRRGLVGRVVGTVDGA
jgi:hypothetical protein